MNFENLTIAQLKKFYEEYKAQNPEQKTAEELLEEKVEMETCTNPCCEGVFQKGTHDMEMCKYVNR